MELSTADRRLIAALRDGLPLVPRPYAALAQSAGMTADAVIARIAELQAAGVITRFGVVVSHRRLGYRANAMVVWDIPDDRVAGIGRQMAREPAVTLCYRRPRRAPDWPYNLFCMIHGREHAVVEAEIEAVAARLGLGAIPRAVLFSRRCFKQAGASYGPPERREQEEWTLPIAAS